MRIQLIPVIALAAVLAAGCSASSSSSSSSVSAGARASHAAKAKAEAKKAAKAEASCTKRKPAYGDLLVRDARPGTQALTADLGGQWQWDLGTGKCLDAVAWTLETAGTASGECMTIALASSNPGYSLDAVPAPKLRKVIAKAGPGC